MSACCFTRFISYTDVVADALDQADGLEAPASEDSDTAAAGSAFHQQAPLCKAQCIAHFTSFAVHIMTGALKSPFFVFVLSVVYILSK